jgi:hypothetical protein
LFVGTQQHDLTPADVVRIVDEVERHQHGEQATETPQPVPTPAATQREPGATPDPTARAPEPPTGRPGATERPSVPPK